MPMTLATKLCARYGWVQLSRRTGKSVSTLKKYARSGAPSLHAAELVARWLHGAPVDLWCPGVRTIVERELKTGNQSETETGSVLADCSQ